MKAIERLWIALGLICLTALMIINLRERDRLAEKVTKLEASNKELARLVVVSDGAHDVDMTPTGILLSGKGVRTEVTAGKVTISGEGGRQVVIFGGTPGQEPYLEVVSPGLPPRRFVAITEILPTR